MTDNDDVQDEAVSPLDERERKNWLIVSGLKGSWVTADAIRTTMLDEELDAPPELEEALKAWNEPLLFLRFVGANPYAKADDPPSSITIGLDMDCLSVLIGRALGMAEENGALLPIIAKALVAYEKGLESKRVSDILANIPSSLDVTTCSWGRDATIGGADEQPCPNRAEFLIATDINGATGALCNEHARQYVGDGKDRVRVQTELTEPGTSERTQADRLIEENTVVRANAIGVFDRLPGSEEALREGCLCPVVPNRHGEGLIEGGWLIANTCPLHKAAALTP